MRLSPIKHYEKPPEQQKEKGRLVVWGHKVFIINDDPWGKRASIIGDYERAGLWPAVCDLNAARTVIAKAAHPNYFGQVRVCHQQRQPEALLFPKPPFANPTPQKTFPFAPPHPLLLFSLEGVVDDVVAACYSADAPELTEVRKTLDLPDLGDQEGTLNAMLGEYQGRQKLSQDYANKKEENNEAQKALDTARTNMTVTNEKINGMVVPVKQFVTGLPSAA